VELFTALIGGLVDQQFANEPGGDRWRRLIGRAIEMYASELDLPASPQRDSSPACQRSTLVPGSSRMY
jgi:hypothetical protein